MDVYYQVSLKNNAIIAITVETVASKTVTSKVTGINAGNAKNGFTTNN